MTESIPGFVHNEMLQRFFLGRFGTPEEVANVILIRSGPSADDITGQTIHVNGGWLR